MTTASDYPLSGVPESVWCTLDTTIDSALIGLAIADLQLRPFRASPALGNYAGRPRDELLGKPLTETLPELAVELEKARAELLGTLAPIADRRVHSIDAEGRTRYWRLSFHPVLHEGRLAGITVVLVNITQQALAETALRESEERYRSLVEHSPDAIFVHLFGPVVFVNAAAAKMYGVSSVADMLGTNIERWIAPTSVPETAQVRARIAAGERVVLKDIFYVTASGDKRCAEGAATLISFYGKPGIQFVMRDTTEQREAAEEICRLNETLEERVRTRTAELEAANAELEAFSYSVSHDLRAPLRHISGHASLLLEDPILAGSATATRHAESIVSAASKMGRLVDELLDFSRVGRAAMHCACISMDATVASVRRDFEPETLNRKIVWNVQPLPAAVGDSVMLTQVWTNLLSNAMKYTRNRDIATIEISATQTEAETLYRVHDNGVGFDMRFANKLFGVFERLHTTREFEGIGIGLANVRRIVERHGGRVWAEAELGRGATFYFSLPRQPA